jgi:carboxyl-terminal processing protease
MLRVAGEIEKRYIRPINREDLLYAALAGWYEAARMPVPKRLKADIKSAAEKDRLCDLILRVQNDVGDSEILQGSAPAMICYQAMARSLDPHSGIATVEEQRHAEGEDEEGENIGLASNDGFPVVVKAVQFGGPAQRAGVRPGDVITEVDGKIVKEESVWYLRRVLNGSGYEIKHPVRSKTIEVTLRRPGRKEPLTVSLERKRYSPETVLGVLRDDDHSWYYFADPERRIAHVRIASLSRGTASELRSVLEKLQEQKLGGLILDLRWCPGGFLDEATKTAELFLGECTIATVKGRESDELFLEKVVYRAANQKPFADFPMLVLVNGETSGGAELIAAALQDHGRAVVAGQRTLGKGSVQTPIPIGVEGSFLKLTTGTLIRPSGKNLHRFPDSKPSDDWGVLPNRGLEFRVTPDLSRAVRQEWLLQSLRPGSSVERLPMDDPTADSQRFEALEALRAKMEKKVRAKGE